MDFRNNPNPGYSSDALYGLGYSFRDNYVHTQCLSYSRDLIRSYANKICNGNIVEIGVLGGATLLDLYELCKNNNNKIYGIDPFEKITIFNGQSEEETNPNIQRQARETYKINREKLMSIISKYNLSDVVTVINETSGDAVAQFEDNLIDLLHIDGDHSTKGVYNDLVNYWPKMKRGAGIIVGDDFNWKSVRCGLDKFCQEYNIKYTSEDAVYKYIINI